MTKLHGTYDWRNGEFEIDEHIGAQVQGDKQSFTMQLGNGVVQVGGVVEVTASPADNPTGTAYIEGVTEIPAPVNGTLITAHATAMNVVDAPTALGFESAFIAVTDSSIKVYACGNANRAKTIPVMWSATYVQEV